MKAEQSHAYEITQSVANYFNCMQVELFTLIVNPHEHMTLIYAASNKERVFENKKLISLACLAIEMWLCLALMHEEIMPIINTLLCKECHSCIIDQISIFLLYS